MIALIASLLRAAGIFFRDRGEVALEVLALRQQLAALNRKRPRPVLSDLDRFFWTILRSVWSRWTDVLVLVKPETVVGWRRAGFRLYCECGNATAWADCTIATRGPRQRNLTLKLKSQTPVLHLYAT
jgi:hypothetical protein